MGRYLIGVVELKGEDGKWRMVKFTNPETGKESSEYVRQGSVRDLLYGNAPANLKTHYSEAELRGEQVSEETLEYLRHPFNNNESDNDITDSRPVWEFTSVAIITIKDLCDALDNTLERSRKYIADHYNHGAMEKISKRIDDLYKTVESGIKDGWDKAKLPSAKKKGDDEDEYYGEEALDEIYEELLDGEYCAYAQLLGFLNGICEIHDKYRDNEVRMIAWLDF